MNKFDTDLSSRSTNLKMAFKILNIYTISSDEGVIDFPSEITDQDIEFNKAL